MLPAAEWEPFFKRAEVHSDELGACKSERSRSIRIGKFLGPMIRRSVPIQVHGRCGTATLRMDEGRGRVKRYGFMVRWDAGTDSHTFIVPTPASQAKPAAGGIPVVESEPAATGSGAPTASPGEAADVSPPTDGGNQEKW